MSLVYGTAGFGAGLVVGVGATLFFIRWRMQSQLGAIEEQIDAMDEMFDEVEDQSS
jgi:hypothetical protein